MGGTIMFVIGRFLGTYLMGIFRDNRMLGIYGLAAAALCVGAVLLSGASAVYALLAVNLFMSIMFPTIFALGIKDLGAETKLGSALIIMAIVGGAILPPIMGVLADQYGIQTSILLPVFCFLIVAWYGFKGYVPQSSASAE